MSNTVKDNVVWQQKYDDQSKTLVDVYHRYRIVKAWKQSTLLSLVNIALRNGWVVTSWEWHKGFFPQARLIKTYRRDTGEEL